MNKIPCEVIMDLIPLVKDHVASPESEKLVYEHIEHCENCRSFMEDMQTLEINDEKIIQNIKIKRNKILLFVSMIGMIGGVLLTIEPYYMFWNILILPIIGILCWIIQPIKTYKLSGVVAVLFSVIKFIYTVLEGSYYTGISFTLIFDLGIVFLLIELGNLLAFLIHYAWKGENNETKN